MSTFYQRLGVLLLCGTVLQLTLLSVECKHISQDLSKPLPQELDILAIPNPCPPDVSPCTCSFDDTTTPMKLSLVCFNLGQASDLKDVFAKFGSMKTFTSLEVMMSTLGSLLPDTFNGVTFREMKFIDAGLTSDGGSFQTSKRTLESMMIVENSFTALNWPLSDDFSGFNSLKTVIVTGPYKGPTKPLNFPSIIDLNLGAGEMDTVDDTTFKSLSTVENLALKNTKIVTLPANVFSELKNLKILQVVRGALTTLSDNSLHVTADSINTIDLSFNEIDIVNPKAFDVSVSKPQVNIDLKSNLISVLKQSDLEPLVTNYGTVSVGGNPFNCDCDDDMTWIINTHFDATLEELDGAYDQCKFPTDVDPEVLKRFYKYQCSTS